MSGVGVAVAQEVAERLELFADLLAHDDAGHRLVSGGDALGERDQVGSDPKGLCPEPAAGSAEAANDLVEDHQRVVVVAETTKAFEVAVRRREDAAGALQRLGQHRRDVGPMLGEDARHRLDVVSRSLHEVGDEVAPSRAIRFDALCTRAAEVHAVIPARALHDDLLVGVATSLLDQPADLQRRVDRLRAGGCKEHPAVRMGRHLGHRICCSDRDVVRERGERVVRGERVHLLGDGVDDPLLVMAHVAEPQAGEAIDVVLALVVPENRTLGLHDVDQVFLTPTGIRERVQKRVWHSSVLDRAEVGPSVPPHLCQNVNP